MKILVNIFSGKLKFYRRFDKFKIREYQAYSISTYDFSTLYTTLPQKVINEQLNAFIKKTFAREQVLLIA